MYNFFQLHSTTQGEALKKHYIPLEFEFCKKNAIEEERNNVVEAMIIIMDFVSYRSEDRRKVRINEKSVDLTRWGP